MSLKDFFNKEVEEKEGNAFFQRFTETTWAGYVGAFIALVVNYYLLWSPTCLTGGIVSLTTFGFPYLLGMKKLKTLLLTGTVVFLLLGITHPIAQQGYWGDTPTPENGSALIQNLSASSSIISAGEPLNFSAWMRTEGPEGGNLTSASIKITHEFHPNQFFWPDPSETPGNYTMEKGRTETRTYENETYNYTLFYYVTEPEMGYYYYIAFSTYENGTLANLTADDYGRVFVAKLFPYYMLSYTLLYAFLFSGFLFYILVGVAWWLRKAKQVRLGSGGGKEKGGSMPSGDFSCSDCGGDVFESEEVCPHCGASFDE